MTPATAATPQTDPQTDRNPQLTAQDWQRALDLYWWAPLELATPSPTVEVTPRIRKLTAAAALNGQPYGFTHADVDRLRSIVAKARPGDGRDWMQTLLERIEQLLPTV